MPAERAGAAGAIAETGNEIGNVLGTALMGSLAALVFRLAGPGLAPTLGETLQLPGIAPTAAVDAKEAFVAGLHTAVAVLTLLHVGLGALALRWLPQPEKALVPQVPA
ncbi:hypothetical protein [Amycolatopsis speibonae]|uniref:hypothetical protein n=1 Tax=Amycolatopsis speibonae TaxID=1450224 RepID=UPI00366E928F